MWNSRSESSKNCKVRPRVRTNIVSNSSSWTCTRCKIFWWMKQTRASTQNFILLVRKAKEILLYILQLNLCYLNKIVSSVHFCSLHFQNVTTCPVDRSFFECILVKNSVGGEVVRTIKVDKKKAEDPIPEDDLTFCEVKWYNASFLKYGWMKFLRQNCAKNQWKVPVFSLGLKGQTF